jgi:hypothetical protein
MIALFCLYVVIGLLAFFHELKNGWRLALFIAVCYPLTMAVGAVGWIVYGVHSAFKGIRILVNKLLN